MNPRKVINHGQERFRVDFGKRSGKRRVRFFPTVAAANKAIAADKKDLEMVGKRWAQLNAEKRLALLNLVEEVESQGMTLRDVWEAYRAHNMTPVEGKVKRTLKQAIAELLLAKQAAKRRPRYLTGLESYLNMFARGRETTPVHQIGAADIDEWFRSRTEVEGDGTKSSNMGRLASLFSFCERRGYLRTSPMKAVERVTVESKVPRILSMDQVWRVLVGTKRNKPEYLCWLTLALLAGLRPEEALQIVPGRDYDPEAGTVRVDAAASKVRDRRIVHLTPAARAWMDCAMNFDPILPMSQSSKKRFQKWLRARLGFKTWPQDILRHSAASYLLSYHQDAGKVAAELGNSVGILLRKYKELVSREKGAKFYSLRCYKVT